MKKGLMDHYSIELFGLADKEYTFELDFNTDLFRHFENEEVESIKGQCVLLLDKKPTMIQLTFNIDAVANLVCDRSLELFEHKISTEKQLLLKYGEEYKEIDDEIVVITPDQLTINVGQWLYEFVAVEVPLKRLHPKFESEDEEEGFFYSDSEEKEDNIEGSDPRWDILKNLKIDDN